MSRIDIRERRDGRIVVQDVDSGVDTSGKTKAVALRNLAMALERSEDDGGEFRDSYEFLRDGLGVEPGESAPE